MTDYQIDHTTYGTIEITTTVPLWAMQDFFRAHGIDPREVPVPSTIRVTDDGQLTSETLASARTAPEQRRGLYSGRLRKTVPLRAPWPPQGATERTGS